jgi:hypothetical protein
MRQSLHQRTLDKEGGQSSHPGPFSVDDLSIPRLTFLGVLPRQRRLALQVQVGSNANAHPEE